MGSKILIVDDDPWLLQMVQTVLVRRGYHVETAADGADGYHKACAFRPDLIVSDVAMPNLDGWGLARALRSRADLAHVPFIFLSAHVSEYEVGPDGGDDYLPKPFRFEDLEVRVSTMLGGPQGQPVAQSPPPVPPRQPTASSVPAVARPPARPPTPAAVAAVAPARKPRDSQPSSQPPPVPGAASRRPHTPTPATVGAVAPAKKGIHGTLDQLGLPSLLMMFEMERKSGILVLHRAGRSARVFVRDGRVLAARVDGEARKGPDCIYHLLSWDHGTFEFSALNVEMTDEMGVSTQHLLMEGARLIDEGKVPRS